MVAERFQRSYSSVPTAGGVGLSCINIRYASYIFAVKCKYDKSRPLCVGSKFYRPRRPNSLRDPVPSAVLLNSHGAGHPVPGRSTPCNDPFSIRIWRSTGFSSSKTEDPLSFLCRAGPNLGSTPPCSFVLNNDRTGLPGKPSPVIPELLLSS